MGRSRSVQCGRLVDRGDVLFDVAVLPGGAISRGWAPPAICRTHLGASYIRSGAATVGAAKTVTARWPRTSATPAARPPQPTDYDRLSRNGRWLLGGMINGPGNAFPGTLTASSSSPMDSCGRDPICRPSEPRFFCSPKAPSPTMIAVATGRTTIETSLSEWGSHPEGWPENVSALSEARFPRMKLRRARWSWRAFR